MKVRGGLGQMPVPGLLLTEKIQGTWATMPGPTGLKKGDTLPGRQQGDDTAARWLPRENVLIHRLQAAGRGPRTYLHSQHRVRPNNGLLEIFC